MHKIILFFLFILLSSQMQAQPSQTINPIKESAHRLFNFNQHDITFNEVVYRLYIAVPKNENLLHPALYMLDGNGQFPMLINTVDSIENNTPLIIGIGYPSLKAYPQERTRDYTIAAPGTTEGGGAENFFSFITQKVKPYIEKNYQIDTTKQTLCGHSYGGLFALYVLFNHTQAFQNYLVASPSLWWGNGAIVPHHRPIFTALPQSVTITLGEYEENPEADPSRKQLSPEILAQKNARTGGIPTRELASWIAEEVSECRFILFKGKNHGSSVPEFLQEALRTAGNKTNR